MIRGKVIFIVENWTTFLHIFHSPNDRENIRHKLMGKQNSFECSPTLIMWNKM